jgi:hypothetical protein
VRSGHAGRVLAKPAFVLRHLADPLQINCGPPVAVARRTLVALDPHEVDSSALAAKFAHHIPDISGYSLARTCAGVAGPCFLFI